MVDIQVMAIRVQSNSQQITHLWISVKSGGECVISKCWDSFLSGLLPPTMTYAHQVQRTSTAKQRPIKGSDQAKGDTKSLSQGH